MGLNRLCPLARDSGILRHLLHVGARRIDVCCACKSRIGKTIGLRNPTHKRFVRMTNTGVMDASAERDHLPDDWTWERFEVVDAGREMIALHNTQQNRFITMTGTWVTHSKLWNEYELPAPGTPESPERFRVVDAGNDEIALHNGGTNRFLRMNDYLQIDTSGVLDWSSLPAHWTWERFQVHESTYIPICPNLYFMKGASCKAFWRVKMVLNEICS